jgi:hypothetical protein
MEKLIITPKTKIYDLLEAYPELEDILIDAAPEFRKLKNPVLRKTITRITNIGHAAVIGRLNVEDLVNRLRSEAGQDKIDQVDYLGFNYNTIQPVWFSKESVVNTIDIREILNRGEQPVHEVLASIRNLNEDEILEIIAPFIPAPLLDKTLSLNYRHWLEQKSQFEYRVYFRK